MKLFGLVAALCVSFLSFAIGEEKELPADLKTARFRYEVEWVELNKNYMNHLKVLKERYTKAGRLDDAIAVDAEIARVAKLSPLKAPIPKNDVELTNYLNGSRWQFEGDKVVTFQDTGEVHKSWGRLRPEWKVSGMKVSYEEKVFAFSDDFSEIRLVEGPSDAGKIGKRIR